MPSFVQHVAANFFTENSCLMRENQHIQVVAQNKPKTLKDAKKCTVGWQFSLCFWLKVTTFNTFFMLVQERLICKESEKQWKRRWSWFLTGREEDSDCSVQLRFACRLLLVVLDKCVFTVTSQGRIQTPRATTDGQREADCADITLTGAIMSAINQYFKVRAGPSGGVCESLGNHYHGLSITSISQVSVNNLSFKNW